MDLKTIYEKVNKKIEKINFQSLWPSFKDYDFALYDADKVILNHTIIPKEDVFIGNTAIKYKGKYLAIWHLENDLDIDVLSAKLIHEMFHAYQNECQDPRFPNEFEAIVQYKQSVEHLSIKYYEHHQIICLLNDFNAYNFNALLAARQYRKTHFPYEYDYETKIEMIEGSAQFVELMVLKQLNEKLYNQKLATLKQAVLNPSLYFPIRVISYDVGTLLLLMLVKNNMTFNQSMHTNETVLDLYLDKQIILSETIDINQTVRKAFVQEKEKLETLLADTIKNQQPVIKGSRKVKAFNVYDARYINGYIMSQYFVMVDQEGILYGDYLFDFKNALTKKIYKIEGDNIWR